MKVDPITTAKPTNADLGRGFNQIHACLEDLKENTERDLNLLKVALAVDDTKRQTVATQSRLSSFWHTVGAVGAGGAALIFAVKIALIVAPFIWGGLVSILHAIETGKL